MLYHPYIVGDDSRCDGNIIVSVVWSMTVLLSFSYRMLIDYCMSMSVVSMLVQVYTQEGLVPASIPPGRQL